MIGRRAILGIALSVLVGTAVAQPKATVPLSGRLKLPGSAVAGSDNNQPAGGPQQNVAGGAAPADGLVVPPGRDPKTYAYDSASEQLLPLSHEEVTAYRAARQRVEKASIANAGPPSIAGTVRTIDMTNGAPQNLSLVSNFSTVIMPIGENGAPWPITQVISANPEIVAVIQPQGRTTTAVLSVKQAWMRTNVTVFLDGRADPLILFVETTADAIEGLDARVGLLVSGIAPGTTLPPVKNITGVDSSLLNAVNSSPGTGWTAFDVKGDQERLPFKIAAWAGKDGQETIVRMQGASLLSPAWDAQVSNADGDVKAYRYAQRPFMFLVSDADGVTYRIRGAAPTAQLAEGQRAKLEVDQLGARQIGELAQTKTSPSSRVGGRPAVPVSLVQVSGPPAPGIRTSSDIGVSAEGARDAVGEGTTPPVHGASSLPPTRSNLKPIFLTGSDAVVRFEASRYHTGESPSQPAENSNSGAAFARATGTALSEPPSVTRANDPLLKSPAANEGVWQFKLSGPSLRYNLERLAHEAGWSRLVWKSAEDYRVSEGLVFRGADALAVVRQVLDRYPLRLEFYELNQVAVVVPRASRSGFIGDK